ncbi:amidohydrolase family protein [Kribbella sancticallisti]|uniref:Amidohydrolase family protein n=1 Tax=Kribbella sancticallisti TaxID=460087 RepID=A0ABP4PLD3_9ACTN
MGNDSLLLSSGTVYDGLGSPGRTADVLVRDGRIASISDVPLRVPSARRIDCTGRVVAPGFVDTHAHSDLVPLLPDPQPFKLLQGVTTEIVGNCGISFAPLDHAAAESAADLVGNLAKGVAVEPGGFAALLDRLAEAGPTNNMAMLVGHNALRLSANGTEPELAPSALARMERLAAEAFEAGAVGFSTGLIYSPGSFAGIEELTALARVAARFGGLYATHMRDEGRRLEAAMGEAVTVARQAGIRLQISHCKVAGRGNHGKAATLVRTLEAARLDGVDVYGDQYPYAAGSTVLLALLPTRATAGGATALAERLSDPSVRALLRSDADRGEPGDGLWAACTPDDVLIIDHTDAGVVGLTLAEVCRSRDEHPFEALCRLVGEDPRAEAALTLMAESDVRTIMASPLVGIGSDSGVPIGLQHPRTWGSFPTVLGRYVRELAVLDLPEALRKATSFGARQFRLTGRGALLPGYIADVTVFDAQTIGHEADYLDPAGPVTGVHTVLLAGEVVVDDGAFNGSRSGRILRRGVSTIAS